MRNFISQGVSKDSISWGIQGDYVEDGVSGATLTITDRILSIAIPISNEDEVDGYFCEEELLLNLVSEALRILDSRRDDRERQWQDQYREKCYKLLAAKLPNMAPSEVRSLRDLIVNGALPVGVSKPDNDNLLAVIDSSLQEINGAAG